MHPLPSGTPLLPQPHRTPGQLSHQPDSSPGALTALPPGAEESPSPGLGLGSSQAVTRGSRRGNGSTQGCIRDTSARESQGEGGTSPHNQPRAPSGPSTRVSERGSDKSQPRLQAAGPTPVRNLGWVTQLCQILLSVQGYPPPGPRREAGVPSVNSPSHLLAVTQTKASQRRPPTWQPTLGRGPPHRSSVSGKFGLSEN